LTDASFVHESTAPYPADAGLPDGPSRPRRRPAVTGRRQFAIVSPQQEYQLGRAWLSLLRGQVNQLNDPQLKDYVETSVYKLAETSQVQDRRLEFILIDSRELNAFAAPAASSGSTAGCSSTPRPKANTPRYWLTNWRTCRNATSPVASKPSSACNCR
jgi:hypothetical protein